MSTNVILTCTKSDAISSLSVPIEPRSLVVLDPRINAACFFRSELSGQQVRDVLAKVEWSEPAAVRLLIQEQGDAAFSVWWLDTADDPYTWHCVLLPYPAQ
jgi:hypothetical protein